MNISNRPIQSIHQVAVTQRPAARSRIENDGADFSRILKESLGESEEVRMSKHAAMRMEARNISLSGEQLKKLKDAVDLASAKGVKDTLVVMDKAAFVVNVGNRTVITAVHQDELKDNIFTNIDGAVFA